MKINLTLSYCNVFCRGILLRSNGPQLPSTEFVKQCEVYIGQLQSEQKLIAAQPIVREGVILKKTADGWIEKNIEADTETQVGYYHILATDLAEAIKIAKDNPEFAYVPSATIEVRPVKTKEHETGFIYPAKNK